MTGPEGERDERSPAQRRAEALAEENGDDAGPPARVLAERERPPGPPRRRGSVPETVPQEVAAAG